MIKPKDYTKQGILNWICIQDDDKDMVEIIQGCHKKINAMNFLREHEKRLKPSLNSSFNPDCFNTDCKCFKPQFHNNRCNKKICAGRMSSPK